MLWPHPPLCCRPPTQGLTPHWPGLPTPPLLLWFPHPPVWEPQDEGEAGPQANLGGGWGYGGHLQGRDGRAGAPPHTRTPHRWGGVWLRLLTQYDSLQCRHEPTRPEGLRPPDVIWSRKQGGQAGQAEQGGRGCGHRSGRGRTGGRGEGRCGQRRVPPPGHQEAPTPTSAAADRLGITGNRRGAQGRQETPGAARTQAGPLHSRGGAEASGPGRSSPSLGVPGEATPPESTHKPAPSKARAQVCPVRTAGSMGHGITQATGGPGGYVTGGWLPGVPCLLPFAVTKLHSHCPRASANTITC